MPKEVGQQKKAGKAKTRFLSREENQGQLIIVNLTKRDYIEQEFDY